MSLSTIASCANDRFSRAMVRRAFGSLHRRTLGVIDDPAGERCETFGQGEPHGIIKILRPEFYRALTWRGSEGFGHGYMDGDWEVQEGSLTDVIGLMIHARDDFKRTLVGGVMQFMQEEFATMRLRSHAERTDPGSIDKSRGNIRSHYDVPDKYYDAILDPVTRCYSCGQLDPTSGADNSQVAMQVRKIDSLCQRLDLQRGEHVLDIGCGKGGFARHATTRYGVHVDGITTSDNHFAAAERARQEGIQNISFYNLDYRDISTSFRDNFFDAVVSIGMLEHVGAKNYLRFFQEVCDSLKPGGRGIIHTIASTEKGGIQDPWIQLEEFPGGYIPHQDEVTDAMFRAGLTPDFERIFRMKEDYAVTLEQWASNAKTAEEELRQADPDFFNDRFFRRKRFFHHGCAAAFRHGDLYVLQVPFAKPRRKADNT